jgi:glyoxylase-like metal-dependent hydrolase (beta-lactamase superfamily II)
VLTEDRKAVMGSIEVKRLEVGMLGTNCYLLQDSYTGEGYIIDPGGDARGILDTANASGLSCLGILCTHGHMDHVGAVGKVAEATGASAFISREDAGILAGSAQGLSNRLGSLFVSKPGGVEFIKGGDTLPLGENTIKVLSTPGHTVGSLSFLAGGGIFCGDLVFQGSIGRTDLKGGSLPDLLNAVSREVWVLPDETKIYPGHGPVTTVGIEKETNPFLRNLD